MYKRYKVNKESNVNELINIKEYGKLSKIYKCYSYEEYVYGLKTLLDFETELSNFLQHLRIIN
jgi:hypothetical protein